MEANVIPAEAEAGIGIRIAEGDAESIMDLLNETIKSVDPRLEIRFFPNRYGPVDINHDVPGFETTTVNYGTDIPNMEGDHKRYLYGPGSILVAHSDQEHLETDDLVQAVDGYKRLVLHAVKAAEQERRRRA